MSSEKFVLLIQSTAIFAIATVWGSEGALGPGPGPEMTSTDGLAIYAPDSSHLWNRLHRAFFVRPGNHTSQLTGDSVDPPLWSDTSQFLQSGSSYREAIDLLDEFLLNDGSELIHDPTRRAVLQHDLWAVFDWCAHARADQADDGERNLTELRSRLADAIKRLALSETEITSLPDNLNDGFKSGCFNLNYDEKSPGAPFLPSDILDPDGPWVCVRGVIDGPSAPVHVEYYKGRSPFYIFITLPGGRKATLKYLRELNQATNKESELPQFPVNTMVALLRRMTVMDTAGRIRVTPLTQTLQMRVYRQVGPKVTDHENSQAAIKFRMNRFRLFADEQGGLQPVDGDEPLRVSLLQRHDLYENEKVQSGIKTVMRSCIACHSCGGATIDSVFTYKQDDWVAGASLTAANRLRLNVTNPAAESKKTINWKMKRFEWGLLKGLQNRSSDALVIDQP